MGENSHFQDSKFSSPLLKTRNIFSFHGPPHGVGGYALSLRIKLNLEIRKFKKRNIK